MDEIHSTDMSAKSRPALGDMTNRQVTAPFNASDDSMCKFGHGFALSADRSFMGSENLANGNILSLDSVDPSLLRRSLSSGLPITCGPIVSSAFIDIPDDEEPPVPARDCAVSRLSVPTCSDSCDERVELADIQIIYPSQESCTGKYGPVEFQKSVLEECVLLNGDASTNSDENFESIRTCSCPFCLKAGYILADLHYQDVAGRLTVLKKSRKEVSNLLKRNPVLKESKRHGDGDGKSDKLSKLENDLIGQWRNLFLHMQDSLEDDKLQEKYTALKELRESCKRDLEGMNGQKPSQRL